MRLWHKDLIKVLPRQQLLGQWRELKLIAKDIREKGKTNHILINKIMNFDLDHFCNYAMLISNEMKQRNYKVNDNVASYIDDVTQKHTVMFIDYIYPDWHNQEYLEICYFNLKEKYLCGGITQIEWRNIVIEYNKEVYYGKNIK